ncbi:hypothetical protein GCM10023100_44950 [Actinocorallia cavernae]|uniref:Uncharacterized protein n=2 Tax=Actinomycetes TaxID=1760 RepID=A0ABP8SX95_9ACTN
MRRGLLGSFPKLTPSGAITLLKAARHYLNALMVANADPEQAWLQLVTAVEVVAVQYQAERFTDLELLQAAHAGLVKDARKSGNEELIPVIAERLSRSMLATRRFLGFLKDFCQALRPDARSAIRVEWTGGRSTRL